MRPRARRGTCVREGLRRPRDSPRLRAAPRRSGRSGGDAVSARRPGGAGLADPRTPDPAGGIPGLGATSLLEPLAGSPQQPPLAARLVESRLREQFGVFAEIHHRTDVPRRTDQGKLPNYRTHRHTLYGRQEGHCGGCRVLFPFRNLTVDHVVPQSKGGTDALENLQLLCGACNSTKGAGTQAELVAVLRQRGIVYVTAGGAVGPSGAGLAALEPRTHRAVVAKLIPRVVFGRSPPLPSPRGDRLPPLPVRRPFFRIIAVFDRRRRRPSGLRLARAS